MFYHFFQFLSPVLPVFSPATRCLRSVVAEAPGGRLLRQVAAGPPRAALVAGAAAGVEGAGTHWASGIDLLGHIGYIMYIYNYIYIYYMMYI
jgi:hypothetical protein